MSPTVRAVSEELSESLDATEEGPPEERYELHPTASKTDLLFACTRPWGRSVARQEVGEGARFGSAFHEGLEAKLNHQHLPGDLAQRHHVDALALAERLEQSLPVITRWLGGENRWKIDWNRSGYRTEVPLAYDFKADKARECERPNEKHEYLDRKPNEIPGTADLVSAAGGILLVLDHKSGWEIGASWQPKTPAESGQLRTLALALSRLWGFPKAIVAFFHCPPGGRPEVYDDELSAADLDQHRKDLRDAYRNIGSGWMRDGPWCSTCPAWIDCPTQRSALVELKRGAGPLTAERVGAIHQAAAWYDQARERLRQELRAWVKAHGPGVRPDGQLVDLVEKEVTGLSQSSILRALGPTKGAQMIEKLRKLGCVETRKQIELRAVKG